jgi:CHAT domain-containing protein
MPHIRSSLFLITIILLLFPPLSFTQEKSTVDGPAVEKFAAMLLAAKTNDERAKLLEVNREFLSVELYQVLAKEGKQLFYKGDLKKALTVYHLAKDVAEQVDYKEGIARMLNSIGYIIYQAEGNVDKAIELCHKSMTLCDELKDEEGYYRALSNLGDFYIFVGRLDEALKIFQGQLKEAEEKKNKFRRAYALAYIGDIYNDLCNFDRALNNYQISLKLFEEMDDKYQIALSLSLIAKVYSSQNNYEQALNYYKNSLEQFEQLDNKLEISRILFDIGYSIYYVQGNYDKALDYFQQSFSLSFPTGNPLYIGQGMHGLGLINRLQGNYDKALEIFQNNLTFARLANFKFGIVITLNEIANLYISQGKFEKAFEFSQQATEIAREMAFLDLLWQTKLTTGIAYRDLNKFEQSRQAFDESIKAIESMRNQTVGGEQAKLSFFQNKIAPYHEMVSLLFKESPSESFTYAERAKARVILDVLRSGKIDITKSMSPQEQEQEQKINNEIVSINSQLYREKQREQSNKERITDLENRLERARLELEGFQTRLYAAHPELRAERTEVQPISLEETQTLMPDAQSALLEFVISEDKTYLFVITQEQRSINLKTYTLEIKRKELEEKVNRFRRMLAEKDLAFRKPARELYTLLLEPAKEQLKGRTTLVIVPEGVLWELPFQVLHPAQTRYLLEDHTIFYTPSLTALREMIKLRRKGNDGSKSSETLLAIGNPAFGIKAKERVESVLLGGKLESLPGTEEQIRGLARLYRKTHSKFYTGQDASEERVKADAGNYKILQFATHGILNNRNPMYSHLVLAQSANNNDEDGLLEGREIVQMGLQAEMAVLAACETARGRVGAGEGIIGLSWAFFVAGCPTTVVSQWKVEDMATKDLMLEFHRLLRLRNRNVKSPITKAAALRQAELKMMRTMSIPHPFYWAGFVIIGDGR